MERGLVGTMFKALLAGLAIIAIGAGIWVLKENADDDASSLPDTVTVVDDPSGITWEMHGEPTLTTGTEELVDGVVGGNDVRTYTVDHGSWVERVKVYDTPAGEMDFATAALTTFDAGDGAELADVEYVEIDGFNAAVGRAPGSISAEDEEAKAATRLFATQIHNYLVTGGVAQQTGADDIDLDEVEAQLRGSMFAI